MTIMEHNLSIHVLSDVLTVKTNSIKQIEVTIDSYKTSLQECEEKIIKIKYEIAELEEAIILLKQE